MTSILLNRCLQRTSVSSKIPYGTTGLGFPERFSVQKPVYWNTGPSSFTSDTTLADDAEAAAALATLRQGPTATEECEHIVQNSKGAPMSTLRLQGSNSGLGMDVTRMRHRAHNPDGGCGPLKILYQPRSGTEREALETALQDETDLVRGKDGVRPPSSLPPPPSLRTACKRYT